MKLYWQQFLKHDKNNLFYLAKFIFDLINLA